MKDANRTDPAESGCYCLGDHLVSAGRGKMERMRITTESGLTRNESLRAATLGFLAVGRAINRHRWCCSGLVN
jgi:hypothetical protein